MLLAAAATVHAVDLPQGSVYDNRIQYANYNEGDVVVVGASVGYVSRIVFGADEAILENGVATGLPEAWEIVPTRNMLLIRPRSIPGQGDTPSMKPKPGQWNTNLVVTTSERLYDIELRLLAAGDSSAPYRVQFEYPRESVARERRARAEQESREAMQAVIDRLPAPRNSSYSMTIGKRSKAITPSMAFDDGRFTYFRFPGNTEMPAVFVIGADGGESTTNPHIDPARDDVLVVDRVAEEFVLRLGRAVVSIHNNAYDPEGLPPVDGAAAPGLRRVTRGTP